jgi:transposase
MAVNDMSFCQRAVTEFLVKEGNSSAVIYARLRGVYEDVCMAVSSVRRWVKHFKDGNTDIADQTRCGRQRTTATERNKQNVDELIGQDRRITFREIAVQLGMGHHAVQEGWRFCNIGKFVPVGFPVCLRVQRYTERLGAALPSILQSGFGPLKTTTCSGL